MSVEVHAAIVGAVIGGAITGLVVLAGLWWETRKADTNRQRDRRQRLVSDVLGELMEALAVNVRTSGYIAELGDSPIPTDLLLARDRSGAQIVSAVARLTTFGPPGLAGPLSRFDDSPKHMGDPATRAALIDLLRVIRDEVLPGEPPVDSEFLESVLFEQPERPREG